MKCKVNKVPDSKWDCYFMLSGGELLSNIYRLEKPERLYFKKFFIEINQIKPFDRSGKGGIKPPQVFGVKHIGG